MPKRKERIIEYVELPITPDEADLIVKLRRFQYGEFKIVKVDDVLQQFHYTGKEKIVSRKVVTPNKK